MQTWDIRTLDVEPHQPQVLRSDHETRVIAIHLPAGEQLQEHQVHERAYLMVADGEVTLEQGGRDGHRRRGPTGPVRAQRASHRHRGQRLAAAAHPVSLAGGGPPVRGARITTVASGGCRGHPPGHRALAGTHPDHVVAARADADHDDGNADEVGHELEVLPRRGGQV